MFEEILKKAADTNLVQNEGDYIKDGLLYCGKCNTPKQVEINLFGKIMKPQCMCECEAAAEEERKHRIAMIQAHEEIERNKSICFLDIETRGCTFGKDDKGNPKVSNISIRYVENFGEFYKKSKGLMFLGNAGTGKSFQAACIANALTDRGYKCLMTNFPRIINEVSGLREGKQEYIDGLNRFDLLIIDDLCIERDTEYTAEIIQNVVDSRYRSGKPLVITSNLTKTEIDNPKDIRKERLFSRLASMCMMIPVVGKDRRREASANKDAEMRKLLGL